MTKIKICGLRYPEEIQYANALRPDYIGFVFARQSRRYITPEQAAALRADLDGGIVPVGVFVDAPAEFAAALLNDGVIDMVQLHGRENADELLSLRKRTGKPLIQAFAIGSAADAGRAKESSADYILADHGTGGTGETFDWSLIRSIQRPLFLAGGLNAANIADAIAAVHPYAVDVSSGAETNGRKDYNKMAALIRAVREERL
jgi:phosphoribosylanthranilate isomerase